MVDDLHVTYGESGPFLTLNGHLDEATAAQVIAVCRVAPERARIEVRGLLGGADHALAALAVLERLGAVLVGASPGLRASIEQATQAVFAKDRARR